MWNLQNLALLWDADSRSVIAGADKLDGLGKDDRASSAAMLSDQVATLARDLDDEWLFATATFMVDDLCKSYFNQFRWTDGVHDYIAATAGAVLNELVRRGFALHYVFDTTYAEAYFDEILTFLPDTFSAAGFVVTGPQLMALHMMEADGLGRDVSKIGNYLLEGLHVANRLVGRCHDERRSSVFLNIDRNDGSPSLPLDVALSVRGTPGTAVVFRNEPPVTGSRVNVCPPPGLEIPGLSASSGH